MEINRRGEEGGKWDGNEGEEYVYIFPNLR